MSALTSVAQQPGTFKSWPPEGHNMTDEEIALLNMAQKQKNPDIPSIPGMPGIEDLDKSGTGTGAAANPSQGRTTRRPF
jgi:hypothetical protein